MTSAPALSRILAPTALATLCAVIGLMAGIEPALAIAGSLIAILALAMLADLAVGLALFILIAFLAVLPIEAGPALSAAKAAGLLLALSWLATVASTDDDRPDFFRAHPGFSYILVALVAWYALSQLWADAADQARFEAYRAVLNVALLPIVFTAVRTRRHVIWVAGAFVVGAASSAVYGILIQPDASSGDLNRLAGTLGDPNQLAALLIAGAVLGAGLAAAMSRASEIPIRALAIGSSALCLLAALLTVSRGGLVALAVLPIAIIAFGGRWRWPALGIWVIGAVTAAAFYVSLAPPEAKERILAADGGNGRTEVWTVGWRMFEDNPVVGVGGGNFQFSSSKYVLEPGVLQNAEFVIDQPRAAHNTYLEVLTGVGLIGLALFLAAIAISLRCALLAAREFARARARDMEILTRTIAIAIAALLTADFFVSDQFSKQLWLLLALGPALLALARSPATRQSTG